MPTTIPIRFLHRLLLPCAAACPALLSSSRTLSRRRGAEFECTTSAMAVKGRHGDGGPSKSKLGRNIDRIQQLLCNHSADGWDKCWEEGLTPWNLDQPTPILQHLHQMDAIPKGRALVPGCGTGYDVVSIACPERFVVGLDISEIAIRRAVQLFSSAPNADHFIFLEEDFFTWHPEELFDLIFDYTFFCAIEPELRMRWAEKINTLLKPDGELITLIFPISDHIGGPPYKVSISDYEEVLSPLRFKATTILDNELAVGPRKGREKIGRWKRITYHSSVI